MENKKVKVTAYEIWETSMVFDDKYLYSFSNKEDAIKHIDNFNRDRCYDEGDILLYYKENTREIEIPKIVDINKKVDEKIMNLPITKVSDEVITTLTSPDMIRELPSILLNRRKLIIPEQSEEDLEKFVKSLGKLTPPSIEKVSGDRLKISQNALGHDLSANALHEISNYDANTEYGIAITDHELSIPQLRLDTSFLDLDLDGDRIIDRKTGREVWGNPEEKQFSSPLLENCVEDGFDIHKDFFMADMERKQRVTVIPLLKEGEEPKQHIKGLPVKKVDITSPEFKKRFEDICEFREAITPDDIEFQKNLLDGLPSSWLNEEGKLRYEYSTIAKCLGFRIIDELIEEVPEDTMADIYGGRANIEKIPGHNYDTEGMMISEEFAKKLSKRKIINLEDGEPSTLIRLKEGREMKVQEINGRKVVVLNSDDITDEGKFRLRAYRAKEPEFKFIGNGKAVIVKKNK